MLATGPVTESWGVADKRKLIGKCVNYCAACDGVFVSIGRKLSTELVKDQLEIDPDRYVIADESTRTNIPGVFAVGDVRTKALRQVVTAVADGAVAVHYAEEYLAGGA